MADLRMRQAENAQPLGWIERRGALRMMDDGSLWRQIFVSYDQSLVDAKRLQTLKDLEIDMLDRFELYDYLEWVGEEAEIDISDMYRMYLGYTPHEE